MNATEIIRMYSNGEISLEAANQALAEIGAIFSLGEPRTGGWTEQEMKEGFFPGKPTEDIPDDIVRGRRMDLAGQVVIQRTKRGSFEVTYDEIGYMVKAILIQ